MDYWQRVADAAVADIDYQMEGIGVQQHGASVQIDGSFKILRVAEAIVKAAIVPEEGIVEEVAKAITPRGEEWASYKDVATDALAAVRGAILTMLDPLP